MRRDKSLQKNNVTRHYVHSRMFKTTLLSTVLLTSAIFGQIPTGAATSAGIIDGKETQTSLVQLTSNDLKESNQVTFDHYSLMIDGKRQFIYSGEFDYWRLPSPSLWLDVLQKMKAAGFNAVTIYFDWGFHSPKKGVYDFTGIRDVDRLLDMAEEAGLYVIARPGPYINAETDAGGFPGWLLTQKGKARTSDKEYTAAYKEWLDHIDPIIAKHQITKGGSVILYQVENEYDGGDAVYMQQLQDKVRQDGINVPLFHNDKSGPRGTWANGPGAPDMYAFDRYPGLKGLPTNFGDPHKFAPDKPIFVAELGGGWFDPWGGPGYDSVREDKGVNYENVVYKNVIAEGATLLSFYMTYGGTNWGYLPFPGVYTSYDYGAAITENRELGPKYDEQKRIAYMLQSVEPLRKTDAFPAKAPENSDIRLDALRNPDTRTQFYILRHEDASSTKVDQLHLTVDSPDGHYTIPQKQNSSIEINGQESKVLIANYHIGNEHLVYSTSELMTTSTNGNRDIALFYGKKDQDGEIVFRYKSEPEVTILSGDVSTTYDQSSGDLRLNYKHTGLSKVVIKSGGNELLLLLGTSDEAAKFWRQDTSQGPVIEKGPYLVRSAKINGDTLELSGDTNEQTSLEVYAPASVKNIIWNGKKLKTEVTDSGSIIGSIAGPQEVKLPDLTDWRFHYESPEAQPNFDDSNWTDANHTTTNSPVKPLSLPVLYADDYEFHHGNVWFRGHFNATGKETAIKLNGDGGANSAYSVWLNGAFLGSASGTKTFHFPKGLLQVGKDNVVSVVLQNMGHDEDGGTNDAHKNPRGLRQAVLQGAETPIEWKIQGNNGGEDLVDSVRGPFNIGGLYGERHGWNLPGYPDGNWNKVTLPNKWSDSGLSSGIGWYRTSFELNLPKNSDVPIGLRLSDDSSRKYRAFIYVNGWLMGQYINNLGPQHVFTLPAGILNPNGHNEIAIAVWGLDQDGARLGSVSLETIGNYAGGVPIEQVQSKGFSADKYGTPVLPNNVAFTLTSDKDLIKENETVRVQGKITNHGQTPILQSDVKLNVPNDWKVNPVTQTTFKTIKPGETKTLEWDIATSAVLNPDDTQIAGFVDFKDKNKQDYTSALYSFTVPLELRPSFYVSELDWESAVSGWNSVQKDSSVSGNIITLLNEDGTNVTYQHGIGTHANSEIVYDIAGENFKKFESYVGVDREDTKGSVTFEVWLDNQKVWDSGLMTGSTPQKFVSVNLAGTKKLRLIVTDSGNGNGHDHADWADAKIINK